tara:strand:+ start:346 stop:483 length:138 start_codon:yes stop_codon:yes gene_type:complete
MKTVIDVLKQSDFSSGLIETKKKKAGNLFPAFFIFLNILNKRINS